MSQENKVCVWLGHDAESLGPDRTSDFPSEDFYCRRCKCTYSVNAWAGPQPVPMLRKMAFYILVVASLLVGLDYLR